MDARHLSMLALVLCIAAAAPALALERGPYSIEVLVDGIPLEEYLARGTAYVEAREGREYSLRLGNHTGRRVAVALAVDGLNTIDARTASAREASKWILEPGETLTLAGWQTGSSTARRFYFTTEESSYGAWLGRTRNLGIISAAVFREVEPEPAPITRQRDLREASPGEDGADRPAASKEAGSRAAEEAPLSDDLAATGIGREVDHRVRRVRFLAEASPAAVLELRYEYHDALVRLGVLPRGPACPVDPLERRERARGFEEPGFAPDPYCR
jgi:hypothetical protein